MDGQGNLERTWKVRKFENKWLRQAVFRKFIYSVQEGKGCTFSCDSLSPSQSRIGGGGGGVLLKERICSLGEQIFSFRVTPKFEVIQLNTIKVKNKNEFFFYLSEGLENC